MYSVRLRSSFMSSGSNSSFSDCACILYAVLWWCNLRHSISTCSSVWIPVPQIHNLSCTGVHDQRPISILRWWDPSLSLLAALLFCSGICSVRLRKGLGSRWGFMIQYCLHQELFDDDIICFSCQKNVSLWDIVVSSNCFILFPIGDRTAMAFSMVLMM